MQIDWFTFFAQIVNFLILIVLLHRFLYKPVIGAMDRREKRIADRLEEARLKMQEANEKESEYENKLKEFDRNKEEMLQQARSEVDQKRKEMMAEAREEIEALHQRWKEALSGEKEAFLQELQIETGDRIIQIVREILEDLASRELNEQVTEIFLQQLSTMEKEENKKLVTSALDYGDGVIDIKSSFEIGEEQRQRILEILQDKIAPKVECRFEVVPALGLGIEIRAGGWRAGWNLNGYIGKLREEMEQVFINQSDDKDGRTNSNN